MMKKMDDEVKIELDCAVEDNELKKFLRDAEKKYGVKTHVIAKNGPGGGWPFISFSGKYENVRDFWVRGYNAADSLEDALESNGLESFDEILD